MRIGIVLSKTPEYSETFFISKIKGLIASGHKVVLFVQNDDNPFSLCDVKKVPSLKNKNLLMRLFLLCTTAFNLLFRSPQVLLKFLRLERSVKRSRVQILKNLYSNSHILKEKLDWVHFGFATIAIQSENVAKAIQAKMAVSFRGYDINVYPEEQSNCYDLVWKRIDKVHAVSQSILKTAYNLGLSRETVCSIITPAIDISRFKLQKKKNSNTIPQILTIGRLHEVKGHKYVIEALKLLSDKRINFNYKIVGEGQQYESLKKLIKGYELENSIELVGKLKHEQTLNYLRDSDFYIQYSISEGFCNALLEAQASGLLCIASDGGGLPENVLHEKTGWIVPKKNSELLLDTILKIIALPNDEKIKISEQAQNRIEEKFSLSIQKELFKNFYEAN